MEKTAHYRRALWLNAGGPTLEAILKSSLGKCPTPGATKFEYQKNINAHIAERSGGTTTGVFFTIYKEGRAAGTIEAGGSTVRRRKAPSGEEFLRTGIYLTVSGNHVCYVADGHTNDGQITGLLHKFFKHAGRRDQDTQFGLHAKADRKQVAKLLKSGVKSIDLGVASFLATVNDLNQEATKSPLAAMFGPLVKSIKNIGAATASASEVEAMGDVEAKVHLGYDGRSAHHLVPKILSKLAADVVDTNEEFSILTRDGNIITRQKLIIKHDVDIAGDEVAIDASDAFAILSGVMREWKTAGVFDD